MADNKNVLITVLVLVVVILLAVVGYSFVIKPAISGYTIKQQQQGVVIAVSSIVTQVSQTGFVQIPLGQNQTLTLVTPQMCPQILQQAQQAANQPVIQ